MDEKLSTLRWGVEAGAAAGKAVYISVGCRVYPEARLHLDCAHGYPAEGGRCMELRVGVLFGSYHCRTELGGKHACTAPPSK